MRCRSVIRNVLPDRKRSLIRKVRRTVDASGVSSAGVIDELGDFPSRLRREMCWRAAAGAPDGDQVIVAAVMGPAGLIASADKCGLLPMRSRRGIPVASARETVVR